MAHVRPADDGVVRRGARLDAEVALEMVIPVEEIRLEIDAAGERDVGCLGAGEDEVCECRVTAYGDGRNVVWVGGEGA